MQNDNSVSEHLIQTLKTASFSREFSTFGNFESEQEEGYKVVGILEIDDSNADMSFTTVVSDREFNTFTDGKDAVYAFAVGEMPEDKEDISKVVDYCYGDESQTERFELKNSVTYELDTVNNILHTLADVFLYIGLGFALFAALMLANDQLCPLLHWRFCRYDDYQLCNPSRGGNPHHHFELRSPSAAAPIGSESGCSSGGKLSACKTDCFQAAY